MDITYHATFGSNRPSEGFPQKRGNITLLWVFCYPVLFSRSCTKVEPMHRFLCWMAQVTFPPKDGPFGGQDNEWHHMGKICPKNSPKRGVHRQFQAKMPKFINRNVSGTINPMNKQFDNKRHFVDGLPLLQSNYNMAGGCHLENRYDVIFCQWVFRFGRNSAAGCRTTRRLQRNGRDRNRK